MNIVLVGAGSVQFGNWIAVEVPAIINKDGVQGINLGELPKGYALVYNSFCKLG